MFLSSNFSIFCSNTVLTIIIIYNNDDVLMSGGNCQGSEGSLSP